MDKGIRKNGKKYRWELCIDGIRHSGTCDTEKQARDARQQALKQHDDMPHIAAPATMKTDAGCPTLQQAIDAMNRSDWSKAKSLHTIKGNCKLLLSYFAPSRPLDTITSKDIDAYIEWLRKRGCKGSTINRKTAILSKLMSHALKREEIQKMPYIERMPESPGRVYYIDTDEEKKILDILSEWHEERFMNVVIVLIDTGIRVGELKKLSIYDIQSDQGAHGIIYLNDTKNGSDRAVPLTERAYNSLMYLANTAKVYGTIYDEYDAWITRKWNRLRTELKKDDDPNFVPHILRHTCCSRLVQKGAPIKKVQMFVGHHSIQTTRRYAHLAPKDIYDLSGMLEK